MRVQCPKCQMMFDDEFRWTLCPHNRLEASPEGDGRGSHGQGYCERHDLFNCPFHGDDMTDDKGIHPAPAEFTEGQLREDAILRFFHYAHLPPQLQTRSKPFCDLARVIVETTPRNAERTVALRKLLEAKDAAVRAALP